MKRLYQRKLLTDGTINPHWKVRKKNEQRKDVRFIAWDGEGADGKYILFRNSAGFCIKCIEGLSTVECLDLLLQPFDRVYKNARHVIFGGGYDVNMLLCDLSREDIYKLWKNGECEWRGYRLSYIPRKSFTVSRVVERKCSVGGRSGSDNRATKQQTRSITLWDVFGFFQTSFVGAMKQYIPDYPPEIYENIVAHKKVRNEFKSEDLEEIAEYCKLEVDALEEIMNRVQKAMQTAEIDVRRWDGAGAVAEGLLRKYRVKEHMCDFSESEPEMHKEAWRAYAGGRIELCRYGVHRGTVWHGDINSAYPSVIRSLPSFRSGSWIAVSRFSAGQFGLWRVRWNFGEYHDRPFFPFFFRDPTGRISYPICGEGSYWSPEVEAALDTCENGIEVLGGWIWTGAETTHASLAEDANPFTFAEETCQQRKGFDQWIWKSENMESNAVKELLSSTQTIMTLPFQFVEEVYQQRKVFKQQKNAAQMILKLGMNSLYGKLAQQIGYKKNEKPAYQQIEWAGWITSATRATLYRVAMQHPDDVISFCTDGLFSTQIHRVSEGSELGEWEVEQHDEIVAAQSGVYWYRNGEEWISKYRGFDMGSLSPHMIITAYENLRWTVVASSTRFIGAGIALQSPAAWKNWRTWPENSRILQLIASGTKRIDKEPFWTVENNPSLRLFDTIPLVNEWAIAGIRSSVYKKSAEQIVAKMLDREEQDGFI